MEAGAKGRAVRAVGREAELAVLGEVVLPSGLPRACVLVGEPGIGKTTLWELSVDLARERGCRVLSTRPAGSEAQLEFAGLSDLLDDVDLEALEGVPAPQRRALDIALLRAAPDGTVVEPRAIATGLLSALRSVSACGPVLVAVDDVQWLDAGSAEALAFAARRLGDEPVGFLLARRPGPAQAFEQAVGHLGNDRVEVRPLSVGATHRLLHERLGLSLPRRLLKRVFELSLGNPLLALELGRTLAARRSDADTDDLPVPDEVDDLIGVRVAELPRGVRRLLLAVALSQDVRVTQLVALSDPESVDSALDDGTLVADEERVRASHPLLAAAAKQRSRAEERRELHLELAQVVTSEALQARHLALGTVEPDEALAATIASAATETAARGARHDGVELAEHALRLTPAGSSAYGERVLALAGHLEAAGEKQRVTDLFERELESLPEGEQRAHAYLFMMGGNVANNDEIRRYFELALGESRGDPELHAFVLGQMAINEAAIRVERIREAEAWAMQALPAARRAGAHAERRALKALSWPRSLSGRPIDDLCDQFRSVSQGAGSIESSPERIAGQRLVWRGDLDAARTLLTRLLSEADARDEVFSYAMVRLHVCELELRAGDWSRAADLLDEWADSPERMVWPMYERCRALLAAGRGHPEEAEAWAAKVIARAEEAGGRWDLLEALRARGTALLLADEHHRAAESLRAVWEHTQREGVDEPGVFPVAPDLVEALVELGEADEAVAVTERLQALADEQAHPWALASARRCAGLIRLAEPYEEAASALAEAASAYGSLGLRFDRGRTLLALGRGERRLKKWGAAGRTLADAAAEFEEIGSTGWAEQARSELERVGARRPNPPGTLTPTEQRVASLAATGLSNKEIAAALFVTVHTVEVHLSHAYKKLGIRSRSQLAGRLSS